MKFFRITIDTYYEAIMHTKRPKYAGAFANYLASYGDTVCYVKGEVKPEFYDALIAKDDVAEFTEEEYLTAISRLKNN